MPSLRLFGADDEARTRYLHLGKVALYRMSYIRKCYDTADFLSHRIFDCLTIISHEFQNVKNNFEIFLFCIDVAVICWYNKYVLLYFYYMFGGIAFEYH